MCHLGLHKVLLLVLVFLLHELLLFLWGQCSQRSRREGGVRSLAGEKAIQVTMVVHSRGVVPGASLLNKPPQTTHSAGSFVEIFGRSDTGGCPDEGHGKLNPHEDIFDICARSAAAEFDGTLRIIEQIEKVPAERLVLVGIHQTNQVVGV